MPLSTLSRPTSPPTQSYPPLPTIRERETPEDRTQRLRDDFEGWNQHPEEDAWSQSQSRSRSSQEEVEVDEVERRMLEREGGVGSGGKGGKRRAWGEWWEKEM